MYQIIEVRLFFITLSTFSISSLDLSINYFWSHLIFVEVDVSNGINHCVIDLMHKNILKSSTMFSTWLACYSYHFHIQTTLLIVELHWTDIISMTLKNYSVLFYQRILLIVPNYSHADKNWKQKLLSRLKECKAVRHFLQPSANASGCDADGLGMCLPSFTWMYISDSLKFGRYRFS